MEKGSYSLLLGCDWIHVNCCVPSTIHQCLIQWHGDNVELVHADDSMSIATVDPMILASDGKVASLRSMMKANSRSKQSALRVCFNG